MKYRKKPVIVEAHQWFKNGDHPDDNVFRPFDDTGETPKEPREGAVVRYFRTPDTKSYWLHCSECHNLKHDHGWIDTSEGGHRVCPGDWIITGLEGERYPCKPSVFAKTYEGALSLPSYLGARALVLKQGPYELSKLEDGSYWLEHQSGEGTQIRAVTVAVALERLWKENF